MGSSVWVEFPSTYCNKVSGLCGAFNPATNYADTYTTATGAITSFSGSPQWGSFQPLYQWCKTEAKSPIGVEKLLHH